MEKPINTRLKTDFGGKNFTFFLSAIQEWRAVFYLHAFVVARNEEISEYLARGFEKRSSGSYTRKTVYCAPGDLATDFEMDFIFFLEAKMTRKGALTSSVRTSEELRGPEYDVLLIA